MMMKSNFYLTYLLCLLRGSFAFQAYPVTGKSKKYNTGLSALPDSLDLPSQFRDAADSIMTVSSSPPQPELLTAAAAAASPSADGSGMDLLSSLGDSGPLIGIAAAVAVAGIAAAAAMAAGGGGNEKATSKSNGKEMTVPEPEPEPIDVSIPYDAAAALAYKSFKSVDDIDDKSEYENFKRYYEAYTAAEVALKKTAREFEGFKATIRTSSSSSDEES